MGDDIHDVLQTQELVFANYIKGANTNAGAILNEAASTINPTILPNAFDPNTGIGSPVAGDDLSIITGAVEALRFTEASSAVIQKVNANVGLTADSGSAQGNGIITSTFNVYDTVGTAGDAATLPATFAVGTIIYVKNGAAANSMDVFPASGDDLGEGANTVLALAAKDFVVFIGTTANATWEQLMTGTCVS